MAEPSFFFQPDIVYFRNILEKVQLTVMTWSGIASVLLTLVSFNDFSSFLKKKQKPKATEKNNLKGSSTNENNN